MPQPFCFGCRYYRHMGLAWMHNMWTVVLANSPMEQCEGGGLSRASPGSPLCQP
jgi:hypothetical protein